MAGTPVCLETCLFAFPVTSSVVSRETLNLPMLALMIPILAASFFLNTEGRFGYSQLVVGSVGTLMDQICICFIFFLNRMIATRRGMKPSLESHTFSGLVRWLDLADETTASDIAIANGCGTQADDKARLSRRGTLLAHDPVDSASGVCPCPLASCAGNLPNFAFWIAMLRSFVMIPIQLYAYLATVLTPLVTFGGSFWRVWWMSICGSLCLLADLLTVLSSESHRLFTVNPGFLSLSSRLHYRAVALSLRSFLDRAAYSLQHRVLLQNAEELHCTLHSVLSQVFQNRMDQQGIYRKVFYSILITVYIVAKNLR